MNAIGLFLTICFVSANGRPLLWSSVWVLRGTVSWWTLLLCSELAALFQPMGGLHYDPVFKFWFPDVLLNAIGLFQPMGSLHYDSVFWVLAARSPDELYWSVPNYLLCFSQWEAFTMTKRLSSEVVCTVRLAIGFKKMLFIFATCYRF
jgi:hypothetical protein